MIRPVGIVEDAQTSAEWIAAALTSSGYRADFSASSLWELERFFDEQAPDGRARSRGLLSTDLGARLFGLGAYLGEVIRRDVGGEWHGDDADPAAEVNVELRMPDGSRIWPIQRVMKRYHNGDEDSIAAYGVALGLPIGARPASRPRRLFRWP
jgi:hypothetical protein